MKAVKALLSLLLVLSLVACSNTNTNNDDEAVVVNNTTYVTLFNEYGADGVTVLYNTFLVDGDTELLPASLGKIDGSYYAEVKDAIDSMEFTEGGEAGNQIARVDIKKGLDIMYLNVYDNNTVSVRKHPEEVFYTVSEDSVNALMTAIQASYDAYQIYLSGN